MKTYRVTLNGCQTKIVIRATDDDSAKDKFLSRYGSAGLSGGLVGAFRLTRLGRSICTDRG
jgi:hypothetical protein